jgi:hypothetical protein
MAELGGSSSSRENGGLREEGPRQKQVGEEVREGKEEESGGAGEGQITEV